MNPYPQNYIPCLVEPREAEYLMRHEETINELAEHLAESDPAMRVHLNACKHARELLAIHDTESAVDEWPRLSAEQLLCVHLKWLDAKLEARMGASHDR